MSERKKVIKGLELCLKTIDEPDCRKECPYYEACQKYEGRVIFQPLMRDILAVLKEQEPKEVKDKSTRIKFLDEYFEGECPSCRSFIDEHSNRNFCGYCGQAVKWE